MLAPRKPPQVAPPTPFVWRVNQYLPKEKEGWCILGSWMSISPIAEATGLRLEFQFEADCLRSKYWLG